MLVSDPEVPGGERAKVLDFGIAKLVTAEPAPSGEPGGVRTRTGAMLGTPTYMAPEQCRGVGAITGRVDLVHANDSRDEFDSGAARHTNFGSGRIEGDDLVAVVSAAGANTCANEKDLRYQIREAGFIPQQRDILYNYVDRPDVDLDSDDSMKLKQLSVAFAD